METSHIKIRGARVHNLKNVSLDIPKDKLVVISGISGSGKSSLAFDTIYAEGQRRYVESLSAYARQFLGIMDKPAVDSIEGLSPAISIDQKSVSKNPRSTVGTITEIHDYLRLLYARIGVPHCPNCGKKVDRQSVSQITDQILNLKEGTSLIILAPVIKDQKGEHQKVIESLGDLGYARLRVDGKVLPAEEATGLKLERYKRHTVEVVVDRLSLENKKDPDTRLRIAESIEQALRIGEGIVNISVGKGKDKEEFIFSENLACLSCHINIPDIEPRTFSFNSPHGACNHCTGLGYTQEIDPKLVFPNRKLTLGEGAIKPWSSASHRVGRQGWYSYILSDLADELGFSVNVPVKDLSEGIINIILYGSSPENLKPFGIKEIESNFEGVVPNLLRRYRETDSEYTRKEIEQYMVEKTCPVCEGRRLRPEALAVKVAGKPIDWVSNESIDNTKEFFNNFFSKNKLNSAEKKIAEPIIKEINHRLNFLLDVGLGYLTLFRSANTLAGGEGQRIRLATQIGSGLTGVVYILDEPSIGLHQRDQSRLIETLKKLRDLGNTVIVVEHDEQTINSADWIVDVGPGAGKHGGKIVFEGTPAELKKAKTITARYMAGKEKIEASNRNSERLLKKAGDKKIIITGAKEHNLKNITAAIPLGNFVCVTGVSGSGKSTLINDILARYLRQHFYSSRATPGEFNKIKGVDNLDKVIIVDQSPIGRTPRSNPATYTGLFTPIRQLFSQTREAQLRGYKPGRFSFNVKGGRCENCEGQGVKKIEMHFLPDIYVECEVCHGSRYNKEALEILYKDKNIAEVLRMPVEEAYNFFKNIPIIKQRLSTLLDVGLGYMELGQAATTLSGGEAQRVKLATELSKRDTGHTLYILDEPTTGLHFDDVKKLLNVLHRLRQKGNTVLVIEHNIDVIKTADWILDLGPEGGEGGGEIIASGTPQDVSKVKTSQTGKFLKEKFSR